MLMPKPDPVFVRASVDNRCNLNCIYCPKQEGMENRVPFTLAGHRLSTLDYCRNLAHIARNGITGISFTGGEPTLNPELSILVQQAAKIFNRVELTSNGFRLLEVLPEIASYLSLLKVSLDTIDESMNSKITRGPRSEAAKACAAIEEACRLGVHVGVNVVVLRSFADQIDQIVAFCRRINAKGYAGNAYVSLLDFYYSPEQRAIWQTEFVPIEFVARGFENRYGPRTAQDRFGCTFYWFDADGVEIRLKDSLEATHRGHRCHECKLFCQEGIYALKHSVEGWVTYCPTGEPSYGAHLAPSLTDGEADAVLNPFIVDIRCAVPDRSSFETMLRTHALRPSALVIDENSDVLPYTKLKILQ
jgi:molybdenum cofactor biosynthesis enzyme MoaA